MGAQNVQERTQAIAVAMAYDASTLKAMRLYSAFESGLLGTFDVPGGGKLRV